MMIADQPKTEVVAAAVPSGTAMAKRAECAAELDLDTLHGLPAEEAARRHAEEGANELQHQKPRTIFAIVLGVMKEPMFLLLLASVVLCFILKDFTEGGMLLFFVLFIIGITIFQERKTERALDALKDLSAPRAVVIRSGKQVTVPGRDVVRGDTILLKEGDRVPADIIVRWSTHSFLLSLYQPPRFSGVGLTSLWVLSGDMGKQLEC